MLALHMKTLVLILSFRVYIFKLSKHMISYSKIQKYSITSLQNQIGLMQNITNIKTTKQAQQ